MRHPFTFARLLVPAIAALSLFQLVTAADGPTPYPDAKDEAAWPGKGPIRSFQWMTDNRKGFWELREKAQGSVVFVGDSLTGGWNPATLAAEFPGLKIANRGIGGEVSRGLLFRFKEDVLDLKPKAIVLCTGTNDLSTHSDVALTFSNIEEIIKQARAYSETVPIVISTIPPRDKADAPTKPGALAELNKKILKLAGSDKNIAIVDPFPLLATADGKPIDEDFSADRIHFAEPGYKKWASLLRPALEKLGVK